MWLEDTSLALTSQHFSSISIWAAFAHQPGHWCRLCARLGGSLSRAEVWRSVLSVACQGRHQRLWAHTVCPPDRSRRGKWHEALAQVQDPAQRPEAAQCAAQLQSHSAHCPITDCMRLPGIGVLLCWGPLLCLPGTPLMSGLRQSWHRCGRDCSACFATLNIILSCLPQ